MISIITPVYNSEKYLEEAIASVVSQSYKDWELILIDDGSTDSSSKICDEASQNNPKIKVLHKKNGGLSSARNAALDMANGDLLLFLDSDDLLAESCLEIFMKIRQETDADIICGKIVEFFSPSDFSKYTDSDKACETLEIFDPQEAIKTTLYQDKLDNSMSGKLFASHIWKNLRFREQTYYEDLDIFYHLFFRANKIVAVDKPVYFYRQHPSSYVHTFNLGRKDMLTVTERLVDFMDTHYPALLPAAKSRQLSANFNMMLLLASHHKNISSDQDKSLAEQANKISELCWLKIKELRKGCLFDPSVRLKNKTGIILSYLGGRPLLKSLARFFY